MLSYQVHNSLLVERSMLDAASGKMLWGNISDKQELCAPAEAERKEISAARSREAGLEFK